METLDCLVKCDETEYEGKLDPTQDPPAFVTEEEPTEPETKE